MTICAKTLFTLAFCLLVCSSADARALKPSPEEPVEHATQETAANVSSNGVQKTDDTADGDDLRAGQKKLSNPGARQKEECAPNDRRCRVDRNIDQLEDTVESVTDKMHKGEMFNLPYEDDRDYKPTKTKYGTKALRYPLRLPTYFLRAFTWPVAIVADQLVKKGVVRKVIDVVSNDERTFWVYPKIEMGFGSGFGGGIGIRHYDLFHRGYQLSATYQIHINMNQEVHMAFGNPNLLQVFGKPFAFKYIADFVHHNEDAYYGIGADSSKNDKATYGYDEVRTGGWFGYNIFKHLLLNGHFYFVWNDSRPGTKGTSIEQRFPAQDIKAFKQSLYYADLGFSLVNDTRDSEVVPEKGGIREFTFSRFEGFGRNNFEYYQFEIDVAQFIRIWKPRHILVLRANMLYQYPSDDGIPFYRLARLDVDSPDRGYAWGRFRDRARAVFNIEYRFPVWDYMDGQLFYDTGRIFHNWSDFSFKHFKHSGGIGLRFRTTNYFLMRFQLAFSPEGMRVLFRTSQAF